MEKISHALTRLMLAIFGLLLAAAVFFGTIGNLQHKSYIVSLAAAVVVTLVLLRLNRGWSPEPWLERLGPAKLALILAGLSLAVNLIWALTHFVIPDGDYVTFWITACAQAKHEALENHIYVGLFPHIMGYASFLGLFLRLLGCHLSVAVGVNIALTVISDLLIFALCLRWGGIREAFLGGLLWAICPSAVMFNTMVLSEPFYTCLLLGYLFLVSGLEKGAAQGKRALWRWVLGGALGGLLLWGVNIARPIAAVFLIATGIWILFLRGKDLRDGGSWARWAAFFALVLLVYIPMGKMWNGYLTQRLDEPPPPIPGYNIYVGFNPETGGSYDTKDMALLGEYRMQTGSAVEAQRLMLQEAKDRIQSGKINFAKLFASKLRIFLGNDEAGAYYTQALIPELYFWLWSALSNVFYYSAAMLSLLCAWRLGRRKEHRLLLLVPLYVIGLTLAQMLVEVADRYHYSIIPMLVILAACAFGKIKEEEHEA